MHAAVLHALGKPPLFEEFPDPTPGEGETLIHVCAAALKPVDKQLASGKHYASPREFPVVCGADGGVPPFAPIKPPFSHQSIAGSVLRC